MNLADISALVAVVDTGSLAHAAVKLNITQPAITRRIQRLEETLGVKLLDRDVKPARLTAEGRTAYAECIRVMNAAEALQNSVGGGPQSARPLRLGISLGASDLVLPALIPPPSACGPVTLEIMPSPEIKSALRECRLEAGVLLRDVGRESSSGERLARLPVSIVASRNTKIPARATLKSLRGHRWVVCPEGCGYRRALEHGLYGAAQPLDIAATLWGFQQQAALVAAGVGLGLIPLRTLQISPHAAELQVVKVSDFSAALDLCLIGPDAASALDPRLAPLRTALLRVLEEPLAMVS